MYPVKFETRTDNATVVVVATENPYDTRQSAVDMAISEHNDGRGPRERVYEPKAVVVAEELPAESGEESRYKIAIVDRNSNDK